jgi:hypothetical protein
MACTRFSLQRRNLPPRRQPNFGQTRAPIFLVANGWPFPKWTPVSLFKSLTQYDRLTIAPFLTLTLKMDSLNGFRRFVLPNSNFKTRRDQRIPTIHPLLTLTLKMDSPNGFRLPQYRITLLRRLS